MQLLTLIVLLFSTESFGDDSNPGGTNNSGRKSLLVPILPNDYTSNLQYNYLEPQFQYPSVGGFNYIQNKQPSFPRSQPPIIFLSGDAPPGQQFLVQQPGALPGNFLIPQPEGPNVILRGDPNQQYPLFGNAYPKSGNVPPIEKDAEEVPNLAGNHPVVAGPTFTARRPEKIETLDEPEVPSEADDLAAAGKNPSPFPKKVPAPQPRLKPGQRFFILNGRPLYSNYPVEPQLHQQYQPNINSESDVFYLRAQPQYIPAPHYQNYQIPPQDLFLRNGVTGEISDVRSFTKKPFERGNFIALNQPEDFRSHGLFVVPSNFELAPVKTSKSGESRLGKNIQFDNQPSLVATGQFLPAYGDGYYFSDLRNSKEEDDAVVIDAKTQEEAEPESINPPSKKDDEEGSLSQSQPSAVAIAGIGGVAAAGPRGTALAGPKGLAVSSPQATAVAGPNTDEEEKRKKPKPKKEKQ